MVRTIALFGALVTPALAAGGSITVNGTVRDAVTATPIDSASIMIVNRADPAERYNVVTDNAGRWTYMFSVAGAQEDPTLPSGLALAQNYPNPFNPSTVIPFSTGRAGVVRLVIHTVLGQVLDVREFEVGPGTYNVGWRSKGAAGVLFYTLEGSGVRVTRKMIQLDGGDGGGLGEARPVGGVAAERPSQPNASVEYVVRASKLGFEDDSTSFTLAEGAQADVSLETVHHRAFVIDLHNDVLEKVIEGYQLGVRHVAEQSDLPRFRDGGVDAQMFALWADPSRHVNAWYGVTQAMIDSFLVQVAKNPTEIGQARTTEEMAQLNTAGKLAGILGCEGGHAIENDIGKLKNIVARGVRYLTITWNNSTSWAVSAQDPLSATQGLSEFGKTVIRTLDSLGVIIDVSHVGIKTIDDILAITTHPIIASHSGVRALNNHSRNLTDTQIRAIAAGGGVIGVVFYPTFLSPTHTATIDTVIAHIDYIRALVGVDCIALGSDFDGIESTPVGLEDVAHLPSLTLALLRHGYTPAEVRKILGENYLRVFRAVCG